MPHSNLPGQMDNQDDTASDRAIERREQDVLGRKAFAERIGQMISKRKGRDSFVISLQGPWGCGKSSVKNMVLDWLRNDCEVQNRPLIIEFEPWQYRDADGLFQGFFDEVAATITTSQLPDSEDKAKRLKQYSKRVAFTGSVANTLGNLLALTPAALVTPAILAAVSLAKEHASHAEGAAAALEGDTQNLQMVKRELRKSMQQLEKLVLVVIDDIDRLYSDEMARVFQLVKANADFPNFVYLLVSHHEVVEKSIEKVTEGSGREYLEKIIQKPISIPKLSQHQVDGAFVNALEELSKENQVPFDLNLRSSIISCLDNGLNDFVKSLRDVYRVINALDFSWPFFISDGTVEVNLADLVALEVLRIYEPDVYALLPAYKPVLLNKSMADKMVSRLLRERHNAQDQPDIEPAEQKLMNKLIDAASPKNRPAVRRVLERLFPDANWPHPVAEGMVRWPTQKGSRPFAISELRVCEEHYFDRYFAFGLADTELSDAEVSSFLKNASDSEVSINQLKTIENRRMAEHFLYRLASRSREVEATQLVSIIKTLLLFGEHLKVQRNNSHFNIISSIEYAIHSLIVSQGDLEEGFKCLSQAFEETESFYVPATLICFSHRREGHSDSLTDETTLKVCETAVREKISQAASNGGINKHPHLLMLIEIWGKGAYTDGDLPATHQWLESYIEDRENLIHLLTLSSVTLLGTPIDATSENVIRGQIELKKDLFPMKQMTNRMRIAREESLSDDQNIYIEKLLPIFESILAQET